MPRFHAAMCRFHVVKEHGASADGRKIRKPRRPFKDKMPISKLLILGLFAMRWMNQCQLCGDGSERRWRRHGDGRSSGDAWQIDRSEKALGGSVGGKTARRHRWHGSARMSAQWRSLTASNGDHLKARVLRAADNPLDGALPRRLLLVLLSCSRHCSRAKSLISLSSPSAPNEYQKVRVREIYIERLFHLLRSSQEHREQPGSAADRQSAHAGSIPAEASSTQPTFPKPSDAPMGCPGC